MLWLTGLALRPDYWWNLPNTFAILLNYTELALITVGLTYVIAAGDIDLSVGAVLALAGSTAAYFLKVLGADPFTAVAMGLLAGRAAGLVNAVVTVGFKLPAFIATLGMFYIARGLAAWFVAGQQLTGWPEGYNLLGRKVNDVLLHFGLSLPPGIIRSAGRGRQRPDDLDVFGRRDRWYRACLHAVRAEGLCGRRQRPRAAYAGINTNRVRFISLMLAALCAAMAGIINVAYFRSFNPVAGQFRELDAIASVIIGGGSIFGGYGTMIGSLAGAAVITLIRALPAAQRPGVQHAAALDQRLHRRHPHRGGADRHMGAPGQYLRTPAGPFERRAAPTGRTQSMADATALYSRSWKCGASKRPSEPCRRSARSI